ncbi:uncharacterized protein LOC110769746 isoform X2 [Prunus avium]|uniref:NADH dehydrogenase [ubiquinone] 1 alpha subcomplex subunit 12 n=1 Tax=Prunus avium TaxID=42229 RepID=A0A6P5TR94_PRUAV|nr:uncharacterized protein LOC110769746 isoform X2 [Prunus avium]
MSKLFQRVAGFFTNRTMVGMDKAGNRYFAKKDEVDGIMKEKRWVVFKGEKDPTSIPVLKKEVERKAREGSTRKVINTDKVGGPDLKSFIRQFRVPSEGDENHEESVAMEGVRNSKEKEAKKAKQDPESIEPIGSGQTFRPGIWQPPT